MDKKMDWSWLPAMMPGVAAMIGEKRQAWGDAHVNLCWRRGVLQGQDGWFFAREGPLAVGTPNALCDALDREAARAGHLQRPMLLMRDPESARLLIQAEETARQGDVNGST